MGGCCWPDLSGAGGVAWGPVLTFAYTQFSDAGTSKSILLYTLPKKGVIHGVICKHSTKFEGGAITQVTASAGIVGDVDRFLTNFIVSTAPADDNFGITHILDAISFGASTALQVTLKSTGGPLNTLTAGSVDLYLLLSAVT